MANVVVSLEDVESGSSSSRPINVENTYWCPENHTTTEGANVYLRAENWLKDVEGLTLSAAAAASLRTKNQAGIEESKTQNEDTEHVATSAERAVVPISMAQGVAMLRYVEEVKMFGNVQDEERKAKKKDKKFSKDENHTPSLQDADFLDEHWKEEVMKQWPSSTTRSVWHSNLLELQRSLDDTIRRYSPLGAFVKLSVRSPKDAVFCLNSTKAHVLDYIKYRGVEQDSPLLLSENVAAIRYASWQGLRCRSGEEALTLLLRSERIYLDVLQHELFGQGDEGKWNLKVHMAPFFEGFDPALEFRGFVAGGVRTALTTYSPWVYDRRIIDNKDEILRLITKVWDQAQSRIQSTDFSIDFAIGNDLKNCWLVEINNFLPPLAGCGLFDYHDDNDRATLEGKREFEFRIKMQPLIAETDFVRRHVNEAGRTTTTVMTPAPLHITSFVDRARGYNLSSFDIDLLSGATLSQA